MFPLSLFPSLQHGEKEKEEEEEEKEEEEGIKERELVYRSRHDTGWRINNCITDRGGQITSKVAGEKDRNPFWGLPDKAARINEHISIIIAGAL